MPDNSIYIVEFSVDALPEGVHAVGVIQTRLPADGIALPFVFIPAPDTGDTITSVTCALTTGQLRVHIFQTFNGASQQPQNYNRADDLTAPFGVLNMATPGVYGFLITLNTTQGRVYTTTHQVTVLPEQDTFLLTRRTIVPELLKTGADPGIEVGNNFRTYALVMRFNRGNARGGPHLEEDVSVEMVRITEEGTSRYLLKPGGPLNAGSAEFGKWGTESRVMAKSADVFGCSQDWGDPANFISIFRWNGSQYVRQNIFRRTELTGTMGRFPVVELSEDGNTVYTNQASHLLRYDYDPTTQTYVFTRQWNFGITINRRVVVIKALNRVIVAANTNNAVVFSLDTDLDDPPVRITPGTLPLNAFSRNLTHSITRNVSNFGQSVNHTAEIFNLSVDLSQTAPILVDRAAHPRNPNLPLFQNASSYFTRTASFSDEGSVLAIEDALEHATLPGLVGVGTGLSPEENSGAFYLYRRQVDDTYRVVQRVAPPVLQRNGRFGLDPQIIGSADRFVVITSALVPGGITEFYIYNYQGFSLLEIGRAIDQEALLELDAVLEELPGGGLTPDLILSFTSGKVIKGIYPIYFGLVPEQTPNINTFITTLQDPNYLHGSPFKRLIDIDNEFLLNYLSLVGEEAQTRTLWFAFPDTGDYILPRVSRFSGLSELFTPISDLWDIINIPNVRSTDLVLNYNIPYKLYITKQPVAVRSVSLVR